MSENENKADPWIGQVFQVDPGVVQIFDELTERLRVAEDVRDAARVECNRYLEEKRHLEQRRDELLALVARLSQTVPLESEVAQALEQRGALLAEIGTLRAAVVQARHEAANRDQRLYIEGWKKGVSEGIDKLYAAIASPGGCTARDRPGIERAIELLKIRIEHPPEPKCGCVKPEESCPRCDIVARMKEQG